MYNCQVGLKDLVSNVLRDAFQKFQLLRMLSAYSMTQE